MIHAPFTEEQRNALFQWQCDPRWHPFTCPNDHGPLQVGETWFCLECDYSQGWAHDFMAVTNP